MNAQAAASVLSFNSVSSLKDLLLSAFALKEGVYIHAADTNKTWGPNMDMALSIAVNWDTLGFRLSAELLHGMSHAGKQALATLWRTLTPVLRESLGAHQAYEPMYPNFPKQVIDAQAVELFVNAYMHYAGDVLDLRILPIYKKRSRAPLHATARDVQVRTLRMVTPEMLAQSFTDHLAMGTAWSPKSRTAMVHLIGVLSVEPNLFSAVLVPNKENLAVLAAAMHNAGLNPQGITASVSSVTDFLRIAVALGATDGDVSLTDKTKMRLGSFSRPWRRMALAWMDQVKDSAQLLENLCARRPAFIRLAKALHPGEYAERFPQAFAAFDALRDDRKLRAASYSSALESAFLQKQGGMERALKILETRPGVFARRLVALLSKSSPALQERALASFEKAARHVAAPLLLDLRTFVERGMDHDHRTAMPKGSITKVYVRQRTHNTLDELVRCRIVSIVDAALQESWSTLPALGSVYMNPDVRGMLVPHGLRNAPSGTRTLVRGSRIPLGAQKDDTVRCFMWWKQADGVRTDLDLSVVLMNDDYSVVEHCSWTQLRAEGLTHSGDITSAPNGACEFLDVQLSMVRHRARFMVMVVNSYTGTAFSDLPEAFSGWMVRSKAQRGDIFDARTVHHKSDLTTSGRVAIPMMIDLETSEVVWLDLGIASMNKVPFYSSYRVEQQHSYLSTAVQALATLAKPTLGDVVDAHMRARCGVMVTDKSRADLVIDWDGALTPFDHEVWSAQWVA